MIQPYLGLEAISRRFGAITALNDLSLDVAEREIVCLVGQSGCGKSTLLRVLAGIDTADSGRIVLDGVELAGSNSFVPPEQRRIGMMFQDYALFPHLNVTDNILFGLKRLPAQEAQQRCQDIVERLGLQSLASRFPHMLSGGEQQRVALARALAPQPHVLLMDEPFSGLDPGLRDHMRERTLSLLRELHTTAIIVTHDPQEALSAGDRVVLMRAGKIEQTGTAAELYRQPRSAYVAQFFSACNRIAATCRNGAADTPLGRFAASGFADGTAVQVYIRPQGLCLVPTGQGVGATVAARRLLGEVEEFDLIVTGLTHPLRLRTDDGGALAIGGAVGVVALPDAAFVFATDADR